MNYIWHWHVLFQLSVVIISLRPDFFNIWFTFSINRAWSNLVTLARTNYVLYLFWQLAYQFIYDNNDPLHTEQVWPPKCFKFFAISSCVLCCMYSGDCVSVSNVLWCVVSYFRKIHMYGWVTQVIRCGLSPT